MIVPPATNASNGRVPPSGSGASKKFSGFGALGLRSKVTLLMGAVVLIVVLLQLVISTLQDEKLLTEKADETCSLLVENLTAAIRDDLLIGESTLPLEEVVQQLSRRKIKGISDIYITNRIGEVVVHSHSELTGKAVDDLMKGFALFLVKDAEHIAVYETAQQYEYVDSIFVGKQRKFIGTSHIRVDKASIIEPIREQQQSMLAIGGATLIFSLVLVLLAVNPILRTIESLSDAMKQVRTGNLDITVTASGNDELGELAFEFSELLITLRRQQTQNEGESAVNIEVTKKGTDEKLFDLTQRQTVATILSTDPKSFNAVSTDYGVRTAIQLAIDYNDIKAKIIEKHGGIVDRSFRGGLRAYFKGAKMADQAMAAAMEIQAMLYEVNQEAQEGQPTMSFGMGISTGVLVATEIQTKNGKTLFAPEVEPVLAKAAYLSAMSSSYGILVTDEVLRQLRVKHEFANMRELSAASDGTPIYQVDIDSAAILKALYEHHEERPEPPPNFQLSAPKPNLPAENEEEKS